MWVVEPTRDDEDPGHTAPMTRCARLRARAVAAVLLVAVVGACSDGRPAADPPPSPPERQPDTAAPATTATTTATGPTVDVGPPGPHWFAPSLDITRLAASYDGATARIDLRISVRDLRPLRRGEERVTQSLTVRADVDAGRDVFVERSAPGAPSVVTRQVASFSHYGAAIERCRGARLVADTDADVLALSLPIVCLTQTRRPTRVSVWVQGSQVVRGQDVSLGSDSATTTRPVRTH